MKCPYRIITTERVESKDGLASPVTVQEFAECYGTECPYYMPERVVSSRSQLTAPEQCGRVINDCMIGQREKRRET